MAKKSNGLQAYVEQYNKLVAKKEDEVKALKDDLEATKDKKEALEAQVKDIGSIDNYEAYSSALSEIDFLDKKINNMSELIEAKESVFIPTDIFMDVRKEINAYHDAKLSETMKAAAEHLKALNSLAEGFHNIADACAVLLVKYENGLGASKNNIITLPDGSHAFGEYRLEDDSLYRLMRTINRNALADRIIEQGK